MSNTELILSRDLIESQTKRLGRIYRPIEDKMSMCEFENYHGFYVPNEGATKGIIVIQEW